MNVKDRKWIKKNTIGCPTCGYKYEKSEGCNHMICYKCRPFTHFCYLCGSQLNLQNPFEHYNNPNSPCNNRLYYKKSKEDSKDITNISFESSGVYSENESSEINESIISMRPIEEKKFKDLIITKEENLMEVKEDIFDESMILPEDLPLTGNLLLTT